MTPSEIDELERLMTAARDLAWHEERNGTRAEQEAEDAELDAERARVDALSDEECIAELATEGIDYDASRKKFDVMLKVCAERADLKREVDRLRAFVPRWRMKRYSPTAVTWRLFVGDTVIPDTGLHPTDKGRVFASGDGECYPDLLTAARAVCARLGIPDVEVPS